MERLPLEQVMYLRMKAPDNSFQKNTGQHTSDVDVQQNYHAAIPVLFHSFVEPVILGTPANDLPDILYPVIYMPCQIAN